MAKLVPAGQSGFPMTLETDGFARIPDALSTAECVDLSAQLLDAVQGGVGTRGLLEFAWCRSLAARLRSQSLRPLLPANHVAVQCTYFEKSKGRNWLVPIHQDISIPVRERRAAPGFGGWSSKEGGLFVQAPPELLAQLTAVRLHLDHCGEDDGPLQVVPGSHALGILEPEAADALRARNGSTTCLADAGDLFVMRPLLLHASSKASGSSFRRVLHYLFGPPQLASGLNWRHAV
jgi:hypothetical protein